MRVYLIGAGMGGADTLTEAARQAIAECGLLVGAKRLIGAYTATHEVADAISPDKISELVRGSGVDTAGVLLSGDVGFYSGALRLWETLGDLELVTIPGLSSLQYFCAKLRMPWQDLRLVSAHGRENNAVGEIQSNPKTFLLTGGATKVRDIARALVEWGYGDVLLHVGENLGSDAERIVSAAAVECAEQDFAELSVVVAENSRAVCSRPHVPGIPDGEFLRGDAPMTKREIRALTLSALRLAPADTVWDVGAGTGSVSIECALSVAQGRVFAVEYDEPALELLARNREKFWAHNLHVVAGRAPEALENLPAPDAVFIGGSSGGMESIIRLVRELNPKARIVANAVTLETFSELVRLFTAEGLAEPEITQIAVTRTRKAGSYHMMDAQNPVWIIASGTSN